MEVLDAWLVQELRFHRKMENISLAYGFRRQIYERTSEVGTAAYDLMK